MGTGEGAGYNVNIPWNAPVVGSLGHESDDVS